MLPTLISVRYQNVSAVIFLSCPPFAMAWHYILVLNQTSVICVYNQSEECCVYCTAGETKYFLIYPDKEVNDVKMAYIFSLLMPELNIFSNIWNYSTFDNI